MKGNSNSTLDLIIQKNIWQPNQPLRLHLGCGENYLDGYINIDYPPKEHPVMRVNADIYQDITLLQFPDGSVDEIRLHHVFEHFSRISALALLIRWHIWLKIGGRLIIETPDLIGSAKTLLSNAPWSRKMAVVRHLAGSHEASWAFHLDHWFPERFVHTLTNFGFGSIETKTFSWQNEPFLSNVIVFAVKKSNLSLNELIIIAEDLLKESLVAEAEKPLFDVWCKQLRTMLQEKPISNTKQESCPGKAKEVSDIEDIQYEELQKMLRNNFRDVSVLIKLAKLELVRANRKKAKNYLIAATTIEPNNEEAKDMLGNIETIDKNIEIKNCITVVFSKDRALQLEATLHSYLNLCSDCDAFPIYILFFASNDFYKQQYKELQAEFKKFEFIYFVSEEDFRKDLMALLAPYEYVLFLTDDNIFVKRFNLQTVLNCLENNPDALGFSLRLGYNTTYCYPLDKTQKLPKFETVTEQIVKYVWVGAEYDFGYPLEVSSSVYRTEDIVPFIAQLPFRNPNMLESVMAENSHQFRNVRPALLCFEKSVTFCAPINMVQTMWKNRSGNREEYSAKNLAQLFEQGFRIDVDAFEGFTPYACHQEVELKFKKVFLEKPPLISIIIPCYNLAEYLPEAVESVVNQTFTNWECIIVNDGSSDNTSEIAKEIISKYPGKRIILVEKENGGPADARNFGIRHSRGQYILPLDADDLIHPSFLEKALNVLLKNPNVHIVYSDLQEFGERSNHILAGDWNPVTLPFQNHLNYCSLYRREVWETVGGYDTKVKTGYEDWDFWIGCAEKGFNGRRIPEPLFLYRIRKVSTYTQAIERDAEIKAQIVLNHPRLYTEAHIVWAKAVLKGEQWTKRIPNVIGLIPPSIPPTVLPPPQSQSPQLASSSQTKPMNDSKVSVIVPTFNRPKMLKNAIQSILNQTFQNLEIIVVNDAGEDVRSVIQSFNDRRIQYISHSLNKGLAATRNTGIRHATGKYIAYLDDDDVFFPDHLETLVDFLENNPEYKIAYTDALRSHQNKVNGNYITVKQDLPYSKDFDSIEILFGNYIPVLCILHQKEILDEIGLFDETLTTHEDWDLWIRISRKYPFYHIKKVTCEFSWREDASTLTSSIREDFFRTMKIIHLKNKPLFLEEIERAVSNGNISLAEAIIAKLLNIFNPKYHPEPLIDLGVIRSLQSRNDEAIQIFRKVLELHPNNEIAYENLMILSQKA